MKTTLGENHLPTDEQNQIDAARASVSTTRRPTVEALEEHLFTPVPVLDHGFVRVVDYMGDDSAVVQAARVSYGRGTKKLNEDRALVRYLMKHQHTTPFEMCEIKFHVKLPIFVARQWIRHRMASINEYSARYSILDKEFYIPEPENLAAQSRSNRQGRGNVVESDEAQKVIELLTADATRSYTDYVWMLNEDERGAAVDESRLGIARELARINLTLNTYTQWYWKIDLHNLMNFLKLRADPHAQYEIRVYADAILQMVKNWVPETYAAFEEYRLGAVSFSRTELEVLRQLLKGKGLAEIESGLSSREISALRTTLQLD